MAPNMGAGGSHPEATTDPEEKQQRQEAEWVLRPARDWRSELSLIGNWADCVDEEPEEEDKHEAEDEPKNRGSWR